MYSRHTALRRRKAGASCPPGAGCHRSAPSVSSWEREERGASSEGGGLLLSLARRDGPAPASLLPPSWRSLGRTAPDADQGGPFLVGAVLHAVYRRPSESGLSLRESPGPALPSAHDIKSDISKSD